jgi:hypothetical protein
MASDISLAVGDGARRHHWPRQVGNDGVVGVIVPLGQGRTGPVPSIEKRTPDHWLDRVSMTAVLFLSLGVWAVLWGAVGWVASAVSW